MFWWEGDLQISVPSAWLFLEGLKSWGNVLDPLEVTEKFPQLQQGQDCIVSLKEMEKAKWQWYLFTEFYSLSNMYMQYDCLWEPLMKKVKKKFKKIKKIKLKN